MSVWVDVSLGKAKIDEGQWITAAVFQKKIARFDIAMHKSMRMKIPNALKHEKCQFHNTTYMKVTAWKLSPKSTQRGTKDFFDDIAMSVSRATFDEARKKWRVLDSPEKLQFVIKADLFSQKRLEFHREDWGIAELLHGVDIAVPALSEQLNHNEVAYLVASRQHLPALEVLHAEWIGETATHKNSETDSFLRPSLDFRMCT
jgi:hypothetical protein